MTTTVQICAHQTAEQVDGRWEQVVQLEEVNHERVSCCECCFGPALDVGYVQMWSGRPERCTRCREGEG